jgi:hypothetical protein
VPNHPLKDDGTHPPLDRRCDIGLFEWEDHNYEWRALCAHIEVKVKATEGPNAARGTAQETAKDIVQQHADVARAHLASRPFQVFSLGMMICGDLFWCIMWDRGGCTISPAFSLINDKETLVRVALQLSRGLSLQELGTDPTVELSRPGNRKAQAKYSFQFANDRWTTETKLFQSLTLVGRGTGVWVVTASGGKGKTRIRCVMKSSWRSRSRRAEHEIYAVILQRLQEEKMQWPKGVAQIRAGDDVAVGAEGMAGERGIEDAISISKLRGGMGKQVMLGEDAVLHRLLLTELGHSLHEYTSARQLLLALKDAIAGEPHFGAFLLAITEFRVGHQSLYELGFLHRDISAGNVLLAEEVSGARHFGFITDLEFVKQIGRDKEGLAMSVSASHVSHFNMSEITFS